MAGPDRIHEAAGAGVGADAAMTRRIAALPMSGCWREGTVMSFGGRLTKNQKVTASAARATD